MSVATSLGVSQTSLHGWVRQDRIDRGDLAGISTYESAELKRANRRIRELEMEVEIPRRDNWDAFLDAASFQHLNQTRI